MFNGEVDLSLVDKIQRASSSRTTTTTKTTTTKRSTFLEKLSEKKNL